MKERNNRIRDKLNWLFRCLKHEASILMYVMYMRWVSGKELNEGSYNGILNKCEFPRFGLGLRHYVRVNNPQQLIRPAVQGAWHFCCSRGELCSSLTNLVWILLNAEKNNLLSEIQEDFQRNLVLNCRQQILDFFPQDTKSITEMKKSVLWS